MPAELLHCCAPAYGVVGGCAGGSLDGAAGASGEGVVADGVVGAGSTGAGTGAGCVTAELGVSTVDGVRPRKKNAASATAMIRAPIRPHDDPYVVGRTRSSISRLSPVRGSV